MSQARLAPAPGQWRVSATVRCPGCGYDLRGSLVSDRCPECGRAVADALLPLVRPERVSNAMRRIGNSYLGLLALLPVATGTCFGWVGLGIVALTTLVRLLAAADLRYRADTGKLPVIGVLIERFWTLMVAEMGLIVLWAVAWAIAAAGGGRGSWVAVLAFGLWLVVALAGCAASGLVGGGLSKLLGNTDIVRLLHVQVRLATGAAIAAVSAGVLFVALLPVHLPVAIGVAALCLPLIGLAVIVVIFMTMAGLSQVASAADRARAVAMEAGYAPQVLDVE